MKPLFVHMPRTGGNSIRRMFGSHIQSYSHDNVAKLMIRLGHRWDDTWKFTILRNPWERAYSLYLLQNHDRKDLLRKFQPENLAWQQEDFHRWLHSGWKEGVYFFTYSSGRMLTEKGALAVDTVFHFQDGFNVISRKIAKHLGIPAPRVLKAKASLLKGRFTYRNVIVNQDDIEWIGKENWVETEVYGYEY